MHNTYMPNEEFDQLKVGDKVTIRQMDDLIHDFGVDIDVPCGWHSEMNDLCGDTLAVESVIHQSNGTTIVYVGEGWALSPEVIEPTHATGVSQEEMATMWENMILGGNDDKKQ